MAPRGGQTRQPKGTFEHGTWFCDCVPRTLASFFQVKKEGQNKGRWFWRCGNFGKGAGCGFFLWQEDAKMREQAARGTNQSIDARRIENTPTGPQRIGSPPPPYTSGAKAGPSGRKRIRPTDTDEDEAGVEHDDNALDDEAGRATTVAETPKKAARTEAHSTPRRKQAWSDEIDAVFGMRTPQTERRDPFRTRFSRPGGSLFTPPMAIPRQTDEDNQPEPGFSSPFLSTPTPATRFKDTSAMDAEDSLVRGVSKLLSEQDVHLSEEAETALKKLLSRQAEGKERALEVLRMQVRAKEAKITELTLRNDTLQAELDAEKAAVEAEKAAKDHMRWEKEEAEAEAEL